MDGGMDMAERKTEDTQMKEYKIGEVAKLLGLTTQALRFYEQEGVVMPRKSENGTRYYSFDELHKLLSFKKYRMAEFTVQDIVEHLRKDTLASLSSQLDDKCDELITRSEELLRRAQALRQFRQEVDDALRNLDMLTECMRPALHMQEYKFNDLADLRAKEQREITAYIEALPATSIAFTRDVFLKEPPQFCMCVNTERAQRWGLSLAHTHLLEPVRCIKTVARFPGSYQTKEPIQDILERIRAQGYTLNTKEPIFSLHVASDVYEGITQICGELYIPIL